MLLQSSMLQLSEIENLGRQLQKQCGKLTSLLPAEVPRAPDCDRFGKLHLMKKTNAVYTSIRCFSGLDDPWQQA